ncbi:unnamed protein product [Clavelina lepadiformis]|uniref:Uncharacterized protein n=1 Tax=Clavelina lepadiformis TaxID=159417 RepID=A0ABP0G9U8_CLALP
MSTKKESLHEASTLRTSSDTSDLLGCGSYATVRRCYFEKLRKTVAVKCYHLKPINGDSNKALQNVERETEVLKRLHHPNIVSYIGFTQWDHGHGIILEYPSAGTLDNLLADTRIVIPWLPRLKFSCEIADGLFYLHDHDPKRAYIHSDLKPQNILLSEELDIKIVDFGSTHVFSKHNATTDSLFLSHTTQHTELYSAPEVLKNPNAKRDPSSDVYSFGIVLFNIITRTNGFGGNPSAAIVELIKSRGQKPNLRKVDEIDLALKQRKNEIYLEIFKDLKMWMEKCYDFNPEKRPVMRQIKEKLHERLMVIQETTTISHNNKIRDFKKNVLKRLDTQSSSIKVGLDSFEHPFEKVLLPCPGCVNTSVNGASTDNGQIELTQLPREDNQQIEIDYPPNSEYSLNNADGPSLPEDDQRLLSDAEIKGGGNIFGTSKCLDIFCRGIYNKWKEFSGLQRWFIIGVPLFLLFAAAMIPIFISNSHECPTLNLTNGLKMKCVNGYKIGSVCDFACTGNALLQGVSKITCERSNLWSSRIPSCKRKECSVITLPDDTEMKCSDDNKVESICNFSCTGDKIIEGSSKTRCNETSLWSTRTPTCKKGCISWRPFIHRFDVTPYKSFNVKYYEANIKCKSSLRLVNLKFVSYCECRDLLSDNLYICHFWASPSGSCEHALSYLVREMNRIDPSRYPMPCDPESMYKKCDNS